MAIGDVTFYPNYIHYVGVDYTAEPTMITQGFACSGGETTGELYDLIDNKRTSVLTVDTSGEATDFGIRIDLSDDITGLNFFIIDNHNFKTALALITFRDSASTDIDLSAAYSGVLSAVTTLESITGDDTIVTPLDGAVLAIPDSTQTDDTFFILVTDYAASNFAADVTIGEICMGVSQTISIAPDINVITNDTQHGVTINQTLGGQKSSFKTMGSRKAWSLSWQSFFAADKTALETVWAVTEGERFPFYIDLGEAATPQLYYVRFAQDGLRFTRLSNNAWSVIITIESEV